MNEELQYVRLWTKLMPSFYQDFHCLMGCCHDTCCCGWKIYFSKKDYLKIKRASKTPELEELTQKAMRRLPDGKRTEREYAEFVTKEGSPCQYQSQDGLCLLQLGCGESVLPEVCRKFPRREMDTALGRFYSLSTGCEAVVAQLWNQRDGIDFIEEELSSGERAHAPMSRELELQPTLISTTIDILQARQFSVSHRLIILGMALDEVKKEGFAQIEIQKWVEKVETWLKHPEILNTVLPTETYTTQAIVQQYMTIKELILQPYFMKVYMMSGGKKDNLNDVVQQYLVQNKNFQTVFGDTEYFWENLLVNTVFYLGIPSIQSETELWDNYVNLCNLYGLFRYTAIISNSLEPSTSNLFCAIVHVSRAMLHNSLGTETLVKRFGQNKSNSLAHMALLVQI